MIPNIARSGKQVLAEGASPGIFLRSGLRHAGRASGEQLKRGWPMRHQEKVSQIIRYRFAGLSRARFGDRSDHGVQRSFVRCRSVVHGCTEDALIGEVDR